MALFAWEHLLWSITVNAHPVEVHKVVRRRGSHILWSLSSQIAIEAESIPLPYCDWKDCVNWKTK
jgi:hypothetical protein